MGQVEGAGGYAGRRPFLRSIDSPLCIAGGVAKQILARRGIHVGAHILAIGTVKEERFPLRPTPELFDAVAGKEFPVLDDDAGEHMKDIIAEARSRGDSIGGCVECAITGLPAGLGGPMFDGVENRLAVALFGIPAVKGVDFGAGFDVVQRHGSENNDPFVLEDGCIVTATNHAGGILGGITNGMPVTMRVAFKPTPSISLPQQTVSLSRMEPAELVIRGRHDPCVTHRAVPVVEAVAALVALDMLLEEKQL